jgi:hypothetical protein
MMAASRCHPPPGRRDAAAISRRDAGAPPYGVKYPLIVLAVSFGEFTITRTARHSFDFPKSDT